MFIKPNGGITMHKVTLFALISIVGICGCKSIEKKKIVVEPIQIATTIPENVPVVDKTVTVIPDCKKGDDVK